MKNRINQLVIMLGLLISSTTYGQGRCGNTGNAIPENKIIGSLVMRDFDKNEFFERVQARYMIPVAPVSIMVDRNIIREFTALSVGYTHKENHKYHKNSWSLTPYVGVSFISDSLLIGNNLSGEFMISTPNTSFHGGLSFLLQNEKWYTHCELRYTHLGNSADGLLFAEFWRNVDRNMAIGLGVQVNSFVHNLWVKDPQRMYSDYVFSAKFQYNINCYIGARASFDMNYNSYEKKRLGGIQIGLVIGIPHPRHQY